MSGKWKSCVNSSGSVWGHTVWQGCFQEATERQKFLILDYLYFTIRSSGFELQVIQMVTEPTQSERSQMSTDSLSLGHSLTPFLAFHLWQYFPVIEVLSQSILWHWGLSFSTPMKSSSSASLWTKPSCLFQSVLISHSLCHLSHRSCCFSLASCRCVPMFSELGCPRRMPYSSCILATAEWC